MKEKFFAFLKKHKVYKKWLKYTLAYRTNLEKLLVDSNAKSFFWGAFVLANANDLNEYNKEDHNFWSHLNDLWQKELEKDPS